jgi:hypothetical protein
VKKSKKIRKSEQKATLKAAAHYQVSVPTLSAVQRA